MQNHGFKHPIMSTKMGSRLQIDRALDGLQVNLQHSYPWNLLSNSLLNEPPNPIEFCHLLGIDPK